ncbi:MAG: DUF3857 domain-containing protein [Caulobacteraceae bacterium]|nr:DUF3857 domain-containing protein [Caulobacteraceae bacterium]
MAISLTAGCAVAASRDIHYGPPGAWVIPFPLPTAAEAPEGAPVRVIDSDSQIRVGDGGSEMYVTYRLKILKPEGLSAGNIVATWSPSSDDITIHGLKIIRAGQVTDVLAKTRFQIIQREDNLDAAMLDGGLTATLQVPGLQVGDELEFAATVRRRDPIFGEKAGGFMQLPVAGMPGAFRARLVWPDSVPLHWRATPDLGAVSALDRDGKQELVYELRDPKAAVPTDGAPARLNVRRRFVYSGFESWKDVSNRVFPLFDKASQLTPNSPVRLEAAKIAATAKDPQERAEAALKLVQDRIRYVYVGLDGRNYRPADADETWSRRFGDCKAKSVLLMALLRELGVEAEPVLVNSQGGDGADQLLPTPTAFDHVVVRTHFGGKAWLLDGTRLGDGRLETLSPPVYRWVLPLRPGPADLEPIKPEPLLRPLESTVLEVDASAGFDKPAKVKVEQVIRGDGVAVMRSSLAGLSAEDAEHMLKRYWSREASWVEPDSVAWRYDDYENLIVLTMTGVGQPDWSGDDQDDRSLEIYSAGFNPPNKLHRPKEQDQTAPWVTGFPEFKRWTTLITLPPATAKWRWAYFSDPVHERLGGSSYWREASLKDGVVRTTMSRRVFAPEISAADAAALNDRLPHFNNKMSTVYQAKAEPKADPDLNGKTKPAQDPVTLTEAANRLYRKGQFSAAALTYDKALAVDSTSLTATIGKAESLDSIGDREGGLHVIDAAIKVDHDPNLALVRASILSQAGRIQEAMATLDALSASHHDNVALLRQVAGEAVYAGADAHAVATLDAVVAMAPTDGDLHRQRALILDEVGRLDDALAELNEANRLEPENGLTLAHRAKLLERLGRQRDAQADIDEAWRIDPSDGGIRSHKAQMLIHAGHAEEAWALLDAWAAHDQSGRSLNGRCWVRGLNDVKLPEAEADCAEAVARGPVVASYWDSYALIALRSGRLKDALDRYNRALALDPRQAASLYGRAVVRSRMGDKSASQADFAAAKAIDVAAGLELGAAGLTP